MTSFIKSTSFLDRQFRWLNHPCEWEDCTDPTSGNVEGGGGKVGEITERKMVFKPAAKKDFWSKTFYSPLLVKSDGAGYVYPVPHDYEWTMEVEMLYTPSAQFDQAGLLVYINENHWMKCGIEYCDGKPRLSVVVTNEFSDWSTQEWDSHAVCLKVHKVKQSSSIVVEAKFLGVGHEYHFIRIAHLSNNTEQDWLVGPFAACPTQQRGCFAIFENWSLGPLEKSSHNPDLESHNV